MIIVTPKIMIDESEIEEKFIRSSGPGGQNVNKVATGVQLRFDVRNSPSLPDAVRERLLHLEANRINAEGILIIDARRYRTQEQNRQDARLRLATIIRKATEMPRPRHPTKATRASQARRIAGKIHRGQIKRLRGTTPDE